MAERDPRQLMQIVGLVVVACVITNIAFFFLSDMYFADRTAIYGMVTGEHVNQVRMTFGVFTAVVGLGTVVSTIQPKVVGLAISGAASIASLVAGVAAMTHDMTPVLPATLIVTGMVLALLIWKTWLAQRGAWAFLIGMTSVLATVLLFGATKVRNVLDIGLWTALIIPGLLAVATVALAMIRDDFRDA